MDMDEIVVVDNLAGTEKWRNLVKRRYVDYLHRDRFYELIRRDALPWKITAVVHLGACSSTTERDADFLMENNFHYSRDLCRYALDKGARFINASSAATYGNGSLGFSDDPALIPQLVPLNMYGYSKQLFDLWLLRHKLQNEVVSLKFFNVYGPNEYHKGAMQSVAVKGSAPDQRRGKALAFQIVRAGTGARRTEARLCLRQGLHGPDGLAAGAQGRLRHSQRGRRNGAQFQRSGPGRIRGSGPGMPAIEYVEMPADLRGKYQNYTCAEMGWLERADCPPGLHLPGGRRGRLCAQLSGNGRSVSVGGLRHWQSVVCSARGLRAALPAAGAARQGEKTLNSAALVRSHGRADVQKNTAPPPARDGVAFVCPLGAASLPTLSSGKHVA